MRDEPIILVFGKTGQVGWELCRSLSAYGKVVAMGREDADLCNSAAIVAIIQQVRPAIIINAAAYTAVDKAEDNKAVAQQINAVAPEVMASEAEKINALLVHYSTDYVFDGNDASPYTEAMATAPLNIYGDTKLEGERGVIASGADYLIFRTSWVYGLRGQNFLLTMLGLMAEREVMTVVDDQFGVPTSSRLIAEVTAAAVAQYLVESNGGAFTSGLYHLSARGETSWYRYAKTIADNLKRVDGFDDYAIKEIQPVGSDQYPTKAKRPQHSVMAIKAIEKRFNLQMPPWEEGVKQCMEDLVNSALKQ